MSTGNKKDGPFSEDDILAFIHPVHLLGLRLDQCLDLLIEFIAVLRPEHARSHPRAQRARAGSDDPRSQLSEEDLGRARAELERLEGVARDCGRWLRWGMGERAGTFETDVHRTVDELLGSVRCMDQPYAQNVSGSWMDETSKLKDLDTELRWAAVNPDDEAESEWYRAIELMKTALTAGMTGLEEMREAAGDFPASKSRMSELYTSVAEAAVDFEEMVKSVWPQLEWAIGDRAKESYGAMIEIGRMMHQTALFFIHSARPSGSDSDRDSAVGVFSGEDLYDPCRQAVAKLLRRLQATLGGRPDRAEPPVVRAFVVNNRQDADKPVFQGTGSADGQTGEDLAELKRQFSDLKGLLRGKPARGLAHVRESRSGPDRPRGMPREEANRKAKAYFDEHGHPGTLRQLAKHIGCSHETLRKCPSIQRFIRKRTPGPTPKAEGCNATSDLADTSGDPLDGLVMEETLQEIRGKATPEECERIEGMSGQELRELVANYNAQNLDASEDSRPKHTCRRQKV